jgi:hypothetical protein
MLVKLPIVTIASIVTWVLVGALVTRVPAGIPLPPTNIPLATPAVEAKFNVEAELVIALVVNVTLLTNTTVGVVVNPVPGADTVQDATLVGVKLTLT